MIYLVLDMVSVTQQPVTVVVLQDGWVLVVILFNVTMTAAMLEPVCHWMSQYVTVVLVILVLIVEVSVTMVIS